MGLQLKQSLLVQLVMVAYNKSDAERKDLEDPTNRSELRDLPSTVTRKIIQSDLSRSEEDLTVIRNASAVLTGLVFFERRDAGKYLLLNDILVSQE